MTGILRWPASSSAPLSSPTERASISPSRKSTVTWSLASMDRVRRPPGMLFLSAEAAFRHDYCPGRLGEDLHPVHEFADERQSLAACRIGRGPVDGIHLRA